MSRSSEIPADDLSPLDGNVQLEPPIELARQQAFRQATGQSSSSGNTTPVDIPTPIRESPSFDYHEERKLRFQDEIYLSHSQRPPPHGAHQSTSRSFGSGSFGVDSPLKMTGGPVAPTSSSSSQGKSPSAPVGAMSRVVDHDSNGSSSAEAAQAPAAAAESSTAGALWHGGKQVQESLELAEEARERATVAGIGRLGLQEGQYQAQAESTGDEPSMIADESEQRDGSGAQPQGETAGEQALRQFSECRIWTFASPKTSGELRYYRDFILSE